MPGKKVPDELMAQAVAEFMRVRDWETVAARHHISERTLRRGVERVGRDPKLAALVEQKAKLLERAWQEEAVEFLGDALRKARELISKAESVKDIRAVMGAIKIVGDLQTVREALNGGQQPTSHSARPSVAAPAGIAGGVAARAASPVH